ncbi:hypothetical protein CPB84DRAFT_1846763 [Gymnopilus junonius]|uniref:Antifreeze protein n=1 Tax=Gymnopilus junonius TaxID=109634 RepID=A0A9P5NQ89_GYMJU|nr:hypothetical protein CPB84DRAFT_1846763 [Gymnopilus junonius]
MLSFQKLFFSAVLLVAASGPVAFAAPVLNHGMAMAMASMPEADMTTALFQRDVVIDAVDSMMAEKGFNPFSALKSLVSGVQKVVATVAPKVASIAKAVKPIVDTVAKAASVTPLAPVANVVDDAVDVVSSLPSAREELD